MTRFFWPIRNPVDMYNVVLQAGVSAERIFEVLETEPNVKDKGRRYRAEGYRRSCQLRGCSFWIRS